MGKLGVVVEKIYKNFIEEVDAIDNGVEIAERSKYKILSGLGTRVKRCNPSWRDGTVSPKHENESFRKAVLRCAEELLEQVSVVVKDWFPARSILEEAVWVSSPVYRQAMQRKGLQYTNSEYELNNNSARCVILRQCCPWQEHLADLEDDIQILSPVSPYHSHSGSPSRRNSANFAEDAEPLLLYAIFPDSRSNTWRIQAVPAKRGSFKTRRGLPAAWRGVRDEELSRISGIPGCVFCHAGGFIGGNATLEGAIQMARAASETPPILN